MLCQLFFFVLVLLPDFMKTGYSRWDLTIEGFDVEMCCISFIDIKFTLKFIL